MTTARETNSGDRVQAPGTLTSHPIASRTLAASVATACAAALAPLAWAQGAPSSADSGAARNPSTQGPTQAELNNADVDPVSWLTSNKGYMGYRYSKLDQINAKKNVIAAGWNVTLSSR